MKVGNKVIYKNSETKKVSKGTIVNVLSDKSVVVIDSKAAVTLYNNGYEVGDEVFVNEIIFCDLNR